MRKKHDFSEHNKVVSGSPHTFNQPAPESGGTPGGGMNASVGGDSGPSDSSSAGFCNGGMKFADGGEPSPEIKGGGLRGTLADYGSALKQTASDIGDAISQKLSPVADTTQKAIPEARTQYQKSENDRIENAIKENGG